MNVSVIWELDESAFIDSWKGDNLVQVITNSSLTSDRLLTEDAWPANTGRVIHRSSYKYTLQSTLPSIIPYLYDLHLC